MEIVPDVWSAEGRFPRVVLTIGSFDGVHLGHRRILDRVVRDAAAREGTAAVLTLRPHPREFFSSSHAANLLTTHDKKLELLEQANVDVVFVLPFDNAAANVSPEAFVEELLCRQCRVVEVVVGHDFRFGRDAAGDYGLLQRLAADHGFQAVQEPALVVDGERVSSSLIRERILEGDLEAAAALLGRRYSIRGRVVPGRGVGASLGFPTANVKPHHSAVPAHGVYAAHVRFGNAARAAAVNIGIAPTIRHDSVVVEAHILDFDNSLLGEDIEIEFVERMRPEKEFPSHTELANQIRRDIQAVRNCLADRSVK